MNQEELTRVRRLLGTLAEYPHGKEGRHWMHSLTEVDYQEVKSLLDTLPSSTGEGE